MKATVSHLLDDNRIWCARQQTGPGVRAVSTGFKALDGQLNGQGLPRGGLTECLFSATGIGEMRWLIPLMRQLSTQGKMLFWVNPPWVPYAPALQQAGLPLTQLMVVYTEREEDQVWSMEQILRSPEAGMMLAWPPTPLPGRSIRRLQLAAAEGDSIGIVMQREACASSHSLASLRLRLSAAQGDLLVHICKQRGGRSHTEAVLPLASRILQRQASVVV